MQIAMPHPAKNLTTRLATGLCAALALAACGGAPTRFALRPPVLRAPERAFSPAPAEDQDEEIPTAIDSIILRPLSHALLFEVWGEALDVSSLDEVPDSGWFQNRTVSPEDIAESCTGGPAFPVTILTSKAGGDTPGFVVEDAEGQRFVIKLDQGSTLQPEISTAGDAITARLYWAAGFNAPCNLVVFARHQDFRIDERSRERLRLGGRRPLTRARLDATLRRASPGPDGTLRFLASRFIEGEGIGTWRGEGTRGDDPNDVIPHEDRRELRGERFLAAWLGHWDSRAGQTYDAYVTAPGGGGRVVHYFLDFGDTLGCLPARSIFPEPRQGFTTVSNLPNVLADMAAFGFARRPWDEVRIDPRYPNLGFFGSDHFEPLDFAPQIPLTRWARAQPQDLAWMARRMARLGVDHVRTAVRSGRLSNPAEEERLVEVLMARRRLILRGSFDRVSPLADLQMPDSTHLCVTDLGLTTGLSDPDAVSYGATARTGRDGSPAAAPLARDGARVCIALPASFAPADAPADSAARYATVDIARTEGDRRTLLRAHFYDLGPNRGYALVGAERP